MFTVIDLNGTHYNCDSFELYPSSHILIHLIGHGCIEIDIELVSCIVNSINSFYEEIYDPSINDEIQDVFNYSGVARGVLWKKKV